MGIIKTTTEQIRAWFDGRFKEAEKLREYAIRNKQEPFLWGLETRVFGGLPFLIASTQKELEKRGESTRTSYFEGTIIKPGLNIRSHPIKGTISPFSLTINNGDLTIVAIPNASRTHLTNTQNLAELYIGTDWGIYAGKNKGKVLTPYSTIYLSPDKNTALLRGTARRPNNPETYDIIDNDAV